ncbi:ATP-binding protein [Marimonas arenosa]|uniref:AAA family ATPase n=1 Tax=Marimonas arenosa TaxID=1795305 RepID=A0AAE3WG03_9RHOB|nr:AAA family ATPase [Marimonas arenosa]MDQ2090943.1 AAA family ATPase [Marimonas arenosa]
MVFRFQDFELDIERRELRRNGLPQPVPPKVFALLVYLAERSDRMVSKAELLDALWPANASEASLQTAVSQLRKALGDDPRRPMVVRTYHSRGFRFVAELITDADTNAPAAALSLRETRLAAVLCVRFCDNDTGMTPAPDRAEDSYRTARALVETHQGQLLHMLIDGFTAVFGMARSTDDAPRQALYCAADLTETLAAAGTMPAFAVETGALELAGSGDAEDGNWAPPNAIERGATALAQTARPGETLLGDSTLQHMGDEITTCPAVSGYRLVTIAERRSGIPARPARSRSGFVGRDAEMAFLLAGLPALQDGRGQAVTLSGPAGIGKSRLVSEFLDRLDRRAFRSAIVHCLPALANTPLAPVRALCATLFADLPDRLTPDPIDKALRRDLLDDAAAPDPALTALSDHQRRKRRNALVGRLLGEVASHRPLVIVIEDVHWTDASSQALFDAMARRIDRHPILLVLTTRPGDQPPLTEAQLQLSPLGHGDSVALLRTNPALARIDDSALETLAERAAGNPFFLEELALATHDGADPARSLPGTVQAVISARISALSDNLRMLLYAVAVIGPPAPADLAAQLLGRSSEALARDAEALMRTRFLREEATGFGFRHMLISDAAYAMVSPRDRTRLHGEIARLLDAGSGAEPARPEQLAWHLQEAGETNRAIGHWQAACRYALHRSTHHEAIAFAEAGIALIDTDTPEAAKTELDLRLAMALALTALRGYGATEVGEAYARASELNRTVRSPAVGFQIDIGLWLNNWVLGRLSKSFAHAKALLATAEGSNAPALKAQAHAAAGEILVHEGQLATGLDHLSTGLTHLAAAPPDSIPAQNAAVACAAYAGWAAALMGDSAAARIHLTTSEEIRDLRENPFAAATHAGLCADLLIFDGDAAGALAVADDAIRISRDHRFPFWLGSGLVERGWALGQLGRAEDGLAEIEQGIAIFEATGAGVQLANWYGLKAETLLRAERFDDALAAARHALACAERTGDRYFAPRIHAVAAVSAEILGEPDAATRHAAEATALAERFGMGAHMLALKPAK